MVDLAEFPTPDGNRGSAEAPIDAIDITTEAFAKRLGNLLRNRRESSKLSVGAMARRSDGHFSRRELRQYEGASLPVDPVSASALATLYQVDLESILPLRTEIEIDPGGGVISAGGVNATFEPGEPESVLETYLRLVRRLRNQERDEMVSLRREDIEGLAAYLGASGETIVEQLGALMGATRTQRRLMAGMFLTGAMVITIAVPSVAAFTGGDTAVDSGASSNSSTAVVQIADADVDGRPGALPFDGPDPIDEPDRDDTDGDGAEGVVAPESVPDEISPVTTPTDAPSTDAPTTDGQGAQTPAPGEQPAPGPVPVDVPEVEVGVGAPPVPSELPPIVEPGVGPVDGGTGPGSGGSGDAGGGTFEPVPAGPGASLGGPRTPSGGGEVLEPGSEPIADDGLEPDVDPVTEPEPEPEAEFEEPEPEPDAGFEEPEPEAEFEESEPDAGFDEADKDKDDKDEGDKDKGDKDKDDKERGLANANQHANPNAGGLENANQRANENANPNR